MRWSELDPQGIVFNPNYLAYFDIGFTEYLRAIGQPYPQAFEAAGTDTFAVAANIAFHAPARMDDMLRILVRTRTLGRTSLEIAFRITCGGALIADGLTTYVNADRTTRKPALLPETLREAIVRYEKTEPQRKSQTRAGGGTSLVSSLSHAAGAAAGTSSPHR